MSMTLGEKLRAMREERGISISEVAEQTRISPLYIKAIESDDYKPLPGGIFNKGFVRSYARYIGFDEAEALSDYAELMAASSMSDEIDQTVHHSQVWTDDTSARSMAPTIIFGVIILALLAGGVALLVRYLSGPSAPSVATNTSNINSESNTVTENLSIPTPQTPAGAFTIGLKAVDESVWIGYTKDGEKSVKTLEPGESLTLEVQNSLQLGYAKVRAQNLEVSINGKRVNVLGGGGKGNFDIDINKTNVAEILESGEIGKPAPVQRPATATTTRPTPRSSASPSPVSPRAPAVNANTVRRPPQ